MKLSEFICQHKDELLGRWLRLVIERLGLHDSEHPQLIDHMPDFLDELSDCLETPTEQWRKSKGAELHGRQRNEVGLDIGAVAEEFGMVSEALLALLSEHGESYTVDEELRMVRIIARGTAESVRAYAQHRDVQLAAETSRHFSFMAHELRTPLQTARLAVQLLSHGKQDPADLIARLERAIEQLAQLVDNSLVEARLRGEPLLHVKEQRSRSLLEEAVANVTAHAARKNIAIALSGDDLALDADRKLIVSALTNLLMNAVKFSRDGARVTASSHRLGDRTLFEIADECGGVPESMADQIFQPFAQAADDRSGFGLGLIIVKQAVEAHAGAIRVVNRAPHGCTFVIDLPSRTEQS